MLPTFNMAGDVVFVDKFSVRKGEVERGDVVIANTPQNAKQMVCKRVIAKVGPRTLLMSVFRGDFRRCSAVGHKENVVTKRGRRCHFVCCTFSFFRMRLISWCSRLLKASQRLERTFGSSMQGPVATQATIFDVRESSRKSGHACCGLVG